MTTLGAAVQQALIKAGVGPQGASPRLPNGFFTLPGGTTVTAAMYFLSTYQWNTNSLNGWIQWRPAAATASNADDIRRITTLDPTDGTYTIAASVADTTATSEDIFILPPWLHPQRIIDAANYALEKIYSENTEPLSTKPTGTGISDPGFQNVATSAYSTSNASFAKETTANSMYVMQGFGSGKVTLSADNGYAYQRFDCHPGEPFRVYAAAACTAGDDAVLTAYDQTGSASIDSVTHAYSTFNWSVIRDSFPATGSGDQVLEVRFGGLANADVIYYGSQCVLFPDRASLFLDTKWDNDFKATSLFSKQFTGSTPTSNVYPNAAARLVPIPSSDYEFSFERGGPNPTAIHWNENAQRKWYEWPVMISGRRPWADFTTALTLSSWATDIPGVDKDLFANYLGAELFGMVDILEADARNSTRLAKFNYELQATASQFHKTGPARSRSFRPFASAP